MSENPKSSFLKTLGRHLVVGSSSLPTLEPNPPTAEELEAKAKADADAAAAAAPVKTSEQLAAEKEAADKAAKEAAAATPPTAPPVDGAAVKAAKDAADKKAADEADAKKKKSTPLPAVPKADLMDDTAPDAPQDAPKPVTELLDFQPSKAVTRYLEVLQAGAERNPEKFQSIFDREVDRLKKVNKFTADWQAEHPDEVMAPDDPKYKQFLKANPPAIDAEDHTDLREQLVAERAAETARHQVREEMAPKLKKVAELEMKPQLEDANTAMDEMILRALPELLDKDDLLVEIAASDGVDALTKVPGEGRLIKEAVSRGRQNIEEYLRIRNGLTKFDPQNQVHRFISQSIATAGEIFEKQGGDNRIRDGRRFVTPKVFAKLKPEARARHFTFEDKDVIDTLSSMAVYSGIVDVKEKRKEEAERDAFRKTRKPAGNAKPTTAAVPPTSSPAIAPTPTAPPGAPSAPKYPNMRKALGIA